MASLLDTGWDVSQPKEALAIKGLYFLVLLGVSLFFGRE